MNSKRVYFDLEPSHSLNVSAYWLLGFVEGEGSFYCSANKLFFFSITQRGNRALFEAIQNYLHDLAPEGLKEDTVHVSSMDKSLNQWMLRVSRTDFVEFVLIPFFGTLTFQTKKYLDYCDWVSIFKIYKKGLHYLPSGEKLVAEIISQMNNNRLSNSGKPRINRMKLLEGIAKLLSLPSNFEIAPQNGKVWIISEQKYLGEGKSKAVALVASDSTVKTFKSLTDCAKFLGISTQTVNSKLLSGLPVKGSGAQVGDKFSTIKRVDFSS